MQINYLDFANIINIAYPNGIDYFPEHLYEAYTLSDVDIKKKIYSAKSCLADWLIPYFENAKYDKNQKTLRGKHGYTLVWRIRRIPNEPISYKNQQTNKGCVIVIRYGK